MQKVNEVFKVQVPLMTNAPAPLALLYNKNRSVQIQMPVDDALDTAMGGQFKKYFHIKGTVDNKKGTFEIEELKETKPQPW